MSALIDDDDAQQYLISVRFLVARAAARNGDDVRCLRICNHILASPAAQPAHIINASVLIALVHGMNSAINAENNANTAAAVDAASSDLARTVAEVNLDSLLVRHDIGLSHEADVALAGLISLVRTMNEILGPRADDPGPGAEAAAEPEATADADAGGQAPAQAQVDEMEDLAARVENVDIQGNSEGDVNMS